MRLPGIKIEVWLSWIIESLFPVINRLPQLTIIRHFCGHPITDWGERLLQGGVLGFLISVLPVFLIWIKIILTFRTVNLASRGGRLRVYTDLSGHLALEALIIRCDWHLLHRVVPSSRDYPRVGGEHRRLSFDATGRVSWLFEILAAVRTAFLDFPSWIKLPSGVIWRVVIAWSVHFGHCMRTIASLHPLRRFCCITLVKGSWWILFWFADAGK